MRVATKQDFAFQALVLCQTKIDRLEKPAAGDPDKKETYESVGKNGSMWRVKPEFTRSRNSTGNSRDGSAASGSRPGTEAA
jgi:hypothetical protein